MLPPILSQNGYQNILKLYRPVSQRKTFVNREIVNEIHLEKVLSNREKCQQSAARTACYFLAAPITCLWSTLSASAKTCLNLPKAGCSSSSNRTWIPQNAKETCQLNQKLFQHCKPCSLTDQWPETLTVYVERQPSPEA